jgi:hypothetical protein
VRIGLFAVLLLSSLAAHSEQYICTYTGFVTNEPVILKIQIDGNRAHDEREEYAVLQNTETGIVLVRSFASYSQDRKRDEVGLFGIVINKSTLKMTRGNIIQGDSDGAVRHGRCVK